VNKNDISGAVVDAAMKIHSALRPGLLESAYAACLKHELIKRGLKVACEVQLPVVYDGVRLDAGYRLDLVVEDRVLVELKAIEAPAPIHQALDLVTIFRSGNPALVPLAKSLLESAEISFVTKGENVQDLIGWGRFPAGLNLIVGPVEFQVDQKDAEEARRLLEDLRESSQVGDTTGDGSDDDG